MLEQQNFKLVIQDDDTCSPFEEIWALLLDNNSCHDSIDNEYKVKLFLQNIDRITIEEIQSII